MLEGSKDSLSKSHGLINGSSTYLYITPARDPKQCGRNEALRADSWKQVIAEAEEMESWKYDGMEL